MTISASSFHRQSCDHLVLPCTIVCNEVFLITQAMNDIGATRQAFIDTLFTQLHGFKFIRLLQPRTLTVVDGRVVTLGPITHFVITQLSLTDESRRVHIEILDLFPTKLGPYLIILGLPWFRKHLPYIWFNKNNITFDSPHYLQHCSPSHQAMTVSGLDTSFHNLSCLPILSDQAVNVSSADDFTLDPRFCLLSYYCCRPCPSLHQAINVCSINKLNDHCSCSTSSFTSSQTLVDIDTLRIHNPHLRYFYNFCHRLVMTDSLKIMNQELLRLKDWVSLTVSASKKEFPELPTMDILIIRVAPFNMLVH